MIHLVLSYISQALPTDIVLVCNYFGVRNENCAKSLSDSPAIVLEDHTRSMVLLVS